ncbi:MAG: hypothetical protein ACLFTK_07595 [Anaerolineales bacterium]
MTNTPGVARNPAYDAAFRKMRRRRAGLRWLRRGGCCLAGGVWLVFLLAIPYVFITLMVEKEIIITRSDVPGHQIRLFFLDSVDQRGFGLQRATMAQGGADSDFACVATEVDYLLWEGDIQPSDYQIYYIRQDERWIQVPEGSNDCPPPDFDFEAPPPED